MQQSIELPAVEMSPLPDAEDVMELEDECFIDLLELPEADEGGLTLAEMPEVDEGGLTKAELPEVDEGGLTMAEMLEVDEGGLTKAIPGYLDGTVRDDILEIFSQPRLVPVAVEAGLRASISVDLETGWDLLDLAKQQECLRMLEVRRPKILMVSPPCTAFSSWQRINRPKMSAAKWAHRWSEGTCLFDFAMDCIALQQKQNSGFCHEHPDQASSWARGTCQQVMQDSSAFVVRFDQCQFGLVSPAGMCMKKRTKLLSNLLPAKTKFNNAFCPGLHRHRAVEGSENGCKISVMAAHYPPKLCEALVEAFSESL